MVARAVKVDAMIQPRTKKRPELFIFIVVNGASRSVSKRWSNHTRPRFPSNKNYNNSASGPKSFHEANSLTIFRTAAQRADAAAPPTAFKSGYAFASRHRDGGRLRLPANHC